MKIVHLCISLLLGATILVMAADTNPTSTPKVDKQDKPEKAEKLTAKGVEFFESKIRPVLTQRCYSCHSSQAKEVKAELWLDTRDGLRKGGESGAAVVPGNVEESLLIQAIKHETYEMPPGDKLADNVIADFEEWVRLGAPDPRVGKAAGSKKVSLAEARSFWAFKKPIAPAVPNVVADSGWAKTDIDRFVLAKLEAKQLHPVGDADRETLVRRVYFDLIGIPPTPDQVDAFMKDSSPEAYGNLIDYLLKTPQFGERWGRHWLDIARFGESTGKERNVPYPYAWRYRDYVIDSFNEDKPYDRFIREQVAGDLLQASSAKEHNANLTGTGFLAIGTKSLNERNREQYLMDQADEQIDVTTRVVLGMTVACARCHDHKFDPISQSDYYAVAGIFRSTEVLAGVQAGNNKSGYSGKFGSMESGEAKPKHTPEQLAAIEKLQSDLKEVRTKRANLSSVNPAKLKGKVAKKAEEAATRLDGRITSLESQIKQAKSESPTGGEPVMAVRDAANPANCRINIRGEVKDLGAEVPRGVPVVLAFDRSAKFDTDHSGRAQFASWLVSKENPLTARVMVNRIWGHLFGRGIVESVDNFGTLGDDPSHPELLDHLAIRFMNQGWSVKKMIKEIMLSRAYQMASDHQDAGFAADPDNRLLWRMNRRRLEAETIRDSILAVSGQLKLERPAGTLVEDNGATEIGRKRGAATPDYSTFMFRSVYLPFVRSRMPDMLAVFDAADPSLIVGQREVTTVATQALFMMNSTLVMQQSTETAKRVLNAAPTNDDERLQYAFRLILGHGPSSGQRERSLAYLKQMERLVSESTSTAEEKRIATWSSLCQTLIASGEFRYVY